MRLREMQTLSLSRAWHRSCHAACHLHHHPNCCNVLLATAFSNDSAWHSNFRNGFAGIPNSATFAGIPSPAMLLLALRNLQHLAGSGPCNQKNKIQCRDWIQSMLRLTMSYLQVKACACDVIRCVQVQNAKVMIGRLKQPSMCFISCTCAESA